MTFEYRHYVPVLRAKEAEWLALDNLTSDARSWLTPLVELTPEVAGAKPKKARRQNRTPLEHAIHLTLGHLGTLTDDLRVFLDFGHLGPQGGAAWTTLHGITNGPVNGIVPVVTAPRLDGRSLELRAMTGNGVGACLRVPVDLFYEKDFARIILNEIAALGISPVATDLVVDLGCDPDSILHARLRAMIPQIDSWRSWTVLGGVFPLDLTQLAASTLEHRLPRSEWLTWVDQINRSATGARRPSFGDYTIQHGKYVPAPKTPGSISVRYTLEDEYLILRGRKPDSAIGVGFDQYYGHARYLTATSDYYGPGFSAGDSFIDGKRTAAVSPGDRRQWLAAGINHHLTATVEQLRAL